MEERSLGTMCHWFCNKLTTNHLEVNYFKDINGINGTIRCGSQNWARLVSKLIF